MLNRNLRDTAIKELERITNVHTAVVENAKNSAIHLFELRQKCCTSVIMECEAYVNTLSNSPKEFEKAVSEYRLEVQEFKGILEDIDSEISAANIKAGGTAGGGALAGAGVAAFAPTAAMAIATTFGTASTGTAIASLSGAAATNAALAWLGGGALAAGGGGMAGGSALLAMAGPIGWGIGISAIVGGGLISRKRNAEIAEKANNETIKITAQIKQLDISIKSIEKLIELTSTHVKGVSEILAYLKAYAPLNYRQFSDDQSKALTLLINHVNSLSELLKKSVK
ncbi:TPA: hypothetical protein ACX6O5_003444 [Photobacterium damselae]